MSERVRLAVVGAHLSGMPLNHQLTNLDAVLETSTTTASEYRLWDLRTAPPKPGLVRDIEGGAAIAVEVWRLETAAFGRFVESLASPMAIGHLHLADGSWVSGFLVEPYAIEDAVEITEYGGWRAYLAATG